MIKERRPLIESVVDSVGGPAYDLRTIFEDIIMDMEDLEIEQQEIKKSLSEPREQLKSDKGQAKSA